VLEEDASCIGEASRGGLGGSLDLLPQNNPHRSVLDYQTSVCSKTRESRVKTTQKGHLVAPRVLLELSVPEAVPRRLSTRLDSSTKEEEASPRVQDARRAGESKYGRSRIEVISRYYHIRT